MTLSLRGSELRRCRSCDAVIVWAVTSSGKRMPVDAKPSEEGRLRLTRLLDGSLVVSVVGGPTEDGELLRRPHFASCPDAESWRKR